MGREQGVHSSGKYAVKESAKVIETGMQMIGKDNADGVIRSWVFQSDGGFGGGVWTQGRQEMDRELDAVACTPDGKELTGSTIYIHVDGDAYTWQAVNQTHRR